jgi:hypothetical protein
LYRSYDLCVVPHFFPFSVLASSKHFFLVSGQAVQVPLVSAAKIPTRLPVLISVPAGKYIGLFLSYNADSFGIPIRECTVGPMPMNIYIQHLEANILVLNPLLNKVIEKCC